MFYDPGVRRVLAVATAPLDLHQTDTGVAEQQAHWWVDALRKALEQVEPQVRKCAAAIGVSGQQHGFVPINARGTVQTPVKLWCDTSTGSECEAIMDAFGGRDACIERVGNPIAPGYTASKIRWLRDTDRDLYEQMVCILLPHDYLNYYLTGVRCMEAGDASGTGFLDIRTRDWSAEMLQAIDPDRDLRDCLPEWRAPHEAAGILLPSIATELGLPSGIPVSVGGGDNMMAAIGTGNVTPGVVTMSLGTSGTVYAYADSPVIDPKGNVAAFCSSTGGWLPLLCTMNCTVTTELMRGLLNTDMQSFEAQLAESPQGANGVITVPFFNGERTPNLPNAKGCVLGLDSVNMTPANLLRSAVEGATFALRFGVDELRALGIEAKEIVLTGGGANSAMWRQIVADVCDLPVTVIEQTEGAALGAALQALAVVEGQGCKLEALCADHLKRDESRCAIPNPSAVRRYLDRYAEYQHAVDKITALYS